MDEISVTVSGPADGTAPALLHDYFADMVGRYYARPAGDAEVAAVMREDPSDDLRGSTGVFVVARQSGSVAGCGGVRFLGADRGEFDGVGELTRIFVEPAARGRGVGKNIVRRLEALAREAGVTLLRLDTRSDLVEARSLYARLGYDEVAPFNSAPYAEHWFSKTLE